MIQWRRSMLADDDENGNREENGEEACLLMMGMETVRMEFHSISISKNNYSIANHA
jgi:hypothetical protein